MKKEKDISNQTIIFKRNQVTDLLVKKVEKAIKRNKKDLPNKCTVYPYWLIDMCADERRKTYPHLTVLTDIETDNKTRIRLLRIELDDYTRQPKKLMRKMIGMTGHGIVLSPIIFRIDELVKAYHVLAKGEKVVADGIFFGIIKDFLRSGLLATFRTIDGSMVHFVTNKHEAKL